MRPSLLSSSALITVASVATVAAVAVSVGVPYVAARSAQPAAMRRTRGIPPPVAAVPGPVAPILLPPPALTVTGTDGKPQTLGLSALEVRATIAGPLAQTSLMMTFRNDSDRALEGNLDFPLPENAVLSGYALDNHGVMVDGVPVEKHEARQIFEAEERKGVDPGLIEQTSGNNFRTRVYPLLPHSERTIRVTYVTDLHAVGSDLVYTVPLHWNQTIPLAKFALTVSDNPVAPELTFGGRDTLLPFTPVGGSLLHAPTQYTMEKTLENAVFADDLTVRLPGLAAQTQTAVEDTKSDGTFFAVADAPPPAPTAPVSGLSATGRLHLGVVWDASVSRLHSDTAHELRLLDTALHGTREATVDVTILRNVADAPRRFVVTNGDTRALVAFLRAVPDDGGTDLSALRLTRGPADLPITAYLLFTDGIDTMAGDPPATVEAPVYAITTDPRANHALLRDLSERSGGAYLNLAERSDRDAVAALGRTPYSLLGRDRQRRLDRRCVPQPRPTDQRASDRNGSPPLALRRRHARLRLPEPLDRARPSHRPPHRYASPQRRFPRFVRHLRQRSGRPLLGASARRDPRAAARQKPRRPDRAGQGIRHRHPRDLAARPRHAPAVCRIRHRTARVTSRPPQSVG